MTDALAAEKGERTVARLGCRSGYYKSFSCTKPKHRRPLRLHPLRSEQDRADPPRRSPIPKTFALRRIEPDDRPGHARFQSTNGLLCRTAPAGTQGFGAANPPLSQCQARTSGCRLRAHAMKLGDRKRSDKGLGFVGHDGELAIRLALIGRKLREELVQGNSSGGQLGLRQDAGSYCLGRLPCVNAGARLHRFPEQRCINNVDENALEHGLGSWASGWGHIVFGRVGVVAA